MPATSPRSRSTPAATQADSPPPRPLEALTPLPPWPPAGVSLSQTDRIRLLQAEQEMAIEDACFVIARGDTPCNAWPIRDLKQMDMEHRCEKAKATIGAMTTLPKPAKRDEVMQRLATMRQQQAAAAAALDAANAAYKIDIARIEEEFGQDEFASRAIEKVLDKLRVTHLLPRVVQIRVEILEQALESETGAIEREIERWRSVRDDLAWYATNRPKLGLEVIGGFQHERRELALRLGEMERKLVDQFRRTQHIDLQAPHLPQPGSPAFEEDLVRAVTWAEGASAEVEQLTRERDRIVEKNAAIDAALAAHRNYWITVADGRP